MPDMIINLRDEASHADIDKPHNRAHEIYASIMIGLNAFMKFLIEQGALTPEQALAWDDDIQRQIKQTLSEQFMYQSENDECLRFMALLRALFSSGNVHIVDRLTKGPPKTHPYSWGWRQTKVNGIDAEHVMHEEALGTKIGYYYEDLKSGGDRQIWLIQELAFEAVQKMARNQGNPITIDAPTLWRRLLEAGYIIKHGKRTNGQKRTDCQQRVDGKHVWVMVLSADVVESD